MSEILEEFVAAGPAFQRLGLLTLLTLARRRRGRLVLARLPLALQAADSLLTMAHYDDPERSRALGWDAVAIAKRGRDLRAAEGRP